jgi:glucoamylase
MTGRAGLIPEQVWDAEPIPERGLFPGKPSGSAMPLVWAHAEFVKLATSIALGRPCDRPQAVWDRYQGQRPDGRVLVWTLRFPAAVLRVGERLRICVPEPALVHFGIDGWQNVGDIATHEVGLGLHVADIATSGLRAGQHVDLTLRWTRTNRWEGRDFRIEVRDQVSRGR